MGDGSNIDESPNPGGAPPEADAGEDDGSTSINGKDDHLKNDQKPTTK
ncbi:MAG: hypothetical protein ACRYGP_10100 [Janthinobacterium lividum]